jgi:hypothetical protein
LIGPSPKPAKPNPKRVAVKGAPGRSLGLPKSGGRKAGAKNKQVLPSAQVRELRRQGIWNVYQRLGGEEWLYKLALEHPALFLSQAWPRIAPPVPRDDVDQGNQVNIQINQRSEIEAARCVAFALAKANHMLDVVQKREQAEPTPQPRAAEPLSAPVEYCPPSSAPAETPELTEQQYRDKLCCGQTSTESIENYHGTEAENGLGKPSPQVSTAARWEGRRNLI